MIQSVNADLLRRCYASDISYKLLLRVVGFVNHVVAFRILGLASFGRLAFVDTVVAIAVLLTNVGWTDVIDRWGALYKADPQAGLKIFTLTNLAVLKNLVLGIVFCLVAVGLQGSMPKVLPLGGLSAVEQMLVCCILVLSLEISPAEQFLALNYEQQLLNRRTLIVSALDILGFYVIIVLWNVTVFSMLCQMVFSRVANLIIIGHRYVTEPEFTWRPIAGLRAMRTELPAIVHYALAMWGNGMLGFLTRLRGMEYFIKVLLGEAAFGLYALGRKMTQAAEDVLFPKSLRQYVGVGGIEIWESRGQAAFHAYIAKYVGLVWVVSGLIAVAGMVGMPAVLRTIYKLDSADSAAYLQSVFFALFILQWMTIYEYCATVVNRPLWFVGIQAVVLPLTLVVYPVVIHALGLIGALGYYVLMNIATATVVAHLLRRHMDQIVPLRGYALLLVVMTTLYVILLRFPLQNVAGAIASAVTLSVMYVWVARWLVLPDLAHQVQSMFGNRLPFLKRIGVASLRRGPVSGRPGGSVEDSAGCEVHRSPRSPD